MFRKAALALAFAIATPALAADQPEPLTNPTMLLDSLTAESVAEIVRELGGQQVQTREADGKRIVTFVDGNIPYNLGIVQCEPRPGKCVGLIMVVIVEGGKFSLENINAQNKSDLFVSVAKFDETRTGIGRALLVDSGVTKKNVGMNIASFAAATRLAIKSLNEQLVASASPAFRPAALAGARPARPVLLSPRDTVRLIAAFDKPHATGLAGPR